MGTSSIIKIKVSDMVRNISNMSSLTSMSALNYVGQEPGHFRLVTFRISEFVKVKARTISWKAVFWESELSDGGPSIAHL